MGFDFSSFVPPAAGAQTPTPTLGALPQGITNTDIPQMNYLLGSPVTNPDDQVMRDTDGNPMGSMQLTDPSGYAQQKAQWDEQQKLQTAGLLTGPQTVGGAEGGNTQTVEHLGSAAPAQLAGHDDYHGIPEQSRLVYDGVLNDTSGNSDNPLKLLDKTATYDDPNWGKLTTEGNVDKRDPGWDTFWKVAPMLPGLFAMGAPALFGGLAGAGGATAGAMVGNQTLSDIGGGAIAQGGSATAGNLLSNMPWLQKAIPNTIKSGISSLNSNNGKPNLLGIAEGLGGQALGASGIMPDMPAWAMPLINGGMNLARGGGFDWTKFIGPGINAITKG